MFISKIIYLFISIIIFSLAFIEFSKNDIKIDFKKKIYKAIFYKYHFWTIFIFIFIDLYFWN